MAGKKIGELTPLGRNLISTDELELSLTGSAGSRKITGAQIIAAAGSTQVGYKGFKYNMGIGEDFPSPPVPSAGQAFILVDTDGQFQGFRISTIDADGKNNSTYLNKINGQPITIANADGSISTYVGDSVTFVGGANPYYNIPPGQFEGPILSGVAYIDYNTSLPALVSGTTIKTINGSSVLGSGDITTISKTPYYLFLSRQGTSNNLFSSMLPSINENAISTYTTSGQPSFLFAQWDTMIGVPSITKIDAATWTFNLRLRSYISGNSYWVVNPQVFKVSTGNVQTLIAQGSTNVNLPATYTNYAINVNIPQTTLLPSDRIVIKLNLQNTGLNTQGLYLSIEGPNPSYVDTTLPQSSPILKSVNGNILEGNGNINIPLPRVRQNISGNFYFYNIGTITGMPTPIEIDIQFGTNGGAGTVNLYRSYSTNSISAGSILAASYSFTSSVRSFRFKRMITTYFESGSGEDGYYYTRGTMYLVGGNAYTDEVPSANPIITQEILFDDSNFGPISYPTYLVIAATNYSAAMWNISVEQGN